MVLERLLDGGGEQVVRVYCQPDRQKGRGKRIAEPPVKTLAERRGLPVAQPVKLRDGAVAAELKADDVDLAVVVAYGRILPPAVFEAPRFGTWNVHASLLPAWRGAAPIQRAIQHGDETTGVTLMQLGEGLDEGPMLLKRSLPIEPDDTAGALTAKMAELGAAVLLEGLEEARRDGLVVEPQDHAAATHAPPIEKAEGQLDLSRPADALARQIRAFDPWPGTFVPTAGGPLKILRAKASPGDGKPGEVLSLSPLRIATGAGALEIFDLQAPGRNPVSAADYLRGAGRHLTLGSAFPE